ncbi:histone-like transcription factor domain containing protein [Babesia ovis]|uniref:Histone-like transcription factor domain containing protein n=1 Tax=Babesia ovis TaxID=5869 RepID=A0A9W5TA11_BABOV|nr:histone-like transcription factor domain containing protein [Babesia ovis]
MNETDASVRPPVSSVEQGDDEHHNLDNSSGGGDVVNPKPYKENYAYTNGNDGTYNESIYGGIGNGMTGFMDYQGDRYTEVKGEKLPLATDSGYGESEGPSPGGDNLGSTFNSDATGRCTSTDPMLAARSYEELFISASKPSGAIYDSGVKAESQSTLQGGVHNQPYYPPNSATSNMHHMNPPVMVNPNSGKHGLPLRPGTVAFNVNPTTYSSDGQSQVTEHGVDVKYPTEHPMSNPYKEEATSHDSVTVSQPSNQHGTTKEKSFPYEPTAYATHTSLDYDALTHGGISLAAFERREIESDTSLPIANIGRVMKSVLPGSAKIAKQAKDIVRECVTEFILFVSSEASDICTNERRKTLSADDILIAMNSLGFEHYNEALRNYHSRWRERDQSSMMDN